MSIEVSIKVFTEMPIEHPLYVFGKRAVGEFETIS